MSDKLTCTMCGEKAVTAAKAPVTDVPVRGSENKMCFDGKTVYLH